MSRDESKPVEPDAQSDRAAAKNEPIPSDATARRIDELADQWEASLIAEETIEVSELCKEDPELVGEVSRRIAELKRLKAELNRDASGESEEAQPSEAVPAHAHEIDTDQIGDADTGFRSASKTQHVKSSVDQKMPPQRPVDQQLSHSSDHPAASNDDEKERFKKLRLHAVGGLGEVYVAEDTELNRMVALKEVRGTASQNGLTVSRFVREAEVTGQLEHPGIVPVYGLGFHRDGRPFYAMKFIKGDGLEKSIQQFHETIDSHTKLDQQNERLRKLIQRIVDVCNAVHYAHSRGVLHRDLKPENIMIGKYGETLVVDWGLARVTGQMEDYSKSEAEITKSDENYFETQAGTLLGTPQFMSPEQAAGRLEELGPATDVYSLGATLYVLLTGKPAIQGATSRHEFLNRVITGEYKRPTDVNARIPQALNAVCCKAMAREQSDRYQTAEELGRELERWLADQPVHAYKEPLKDRALRWARQHQASMTIATLCLITAIVSLSLALFAVNFKRKEAKDNAAQAIAARQTAESARRVNLENSARFLARSIAYEIDLRWSILESEAVRMKLRELVARYNESPRVDALVGQPLDSEVDLSEWSELQSYLKRRFDANAPNIKCKSWTLTGTKGVQFARAPWGTSIGHHYGHRDYFHAQGADFEPGSPEAIAARPFSDRPIHMSAVFESTVTHHLMVAFGVPVHHPDDEDESGAPIGILTMSVELGDFDLENNAMIVETRVDQLTKKRGLILHHRDLGPSSESELPPRLAEDYLQKIVDWQDKNKSRTSTKSINILQEFEDPLTTYRGLAAVEPVIVGRRNHKVSDTGWVVIVKEPDGETSEPTEQ